MIGVTRSNFDHSETIEGYYPLDEIKDKVNSLLFKILRYLPADDLGNFSLTNLSHNSIVSVSNQDLWKALDLRRLFPSLGLRVVDTKVLKEYVPMSSGLSFQSQTSLNNRLLIQELHKASALPIESNAGITVLQLSDITPSEEFTLNKFIAIGKSLELEYGITFFNYISPYVTNKYGNVPIDVDGYILVTNNVIEGTRDKSFEEQKKIVEPYGYDAPEIPYVIIAAFFAFLIDGESFFNYEPRSTRTRTSNEVNAYQASLYPTIGDFRSVGINITEFGFVSDGDAMAAQLKIIP